MKKIFIAIKDIDRTISKRSLIFMLGWQDIKQRYRRSKLGPFWLTISMGVMIGTIGIVFGQVFKSSMTEYLPFLACGVIFWAFFSSTIIEGSSSYIESAGMIRQLDLPLALYPAKVLWRNIIILFHNLAILPFVYLVVGKGVTWTVIFIVPGLILFILNLYWIAIFLAIICTRFRDMPQIVNSVLQVLFYVTPVIWMPNALSARSASLLMTPNPVYHLLEIVRAPLLGYAPELLSWLVCFTMVVFGFSITLLFFGNYKKRIAYWL